MTILDLFKPGVTMKLKPKSMKSFKPFYPVKLKPMFLKPNQRKKVQRAQRNIMPKLAEEIPLKINLK